MVNLKKYNDVLKLFVIFLTFVFIPFQKLKTAQSLSKETSRVTALKL
jgi:hypothetical protein